MVMSGTNGFSSIDTDHFNGVFTEIASILWTILVQSPNHLSIPNRLDTVELQWLEHLWLVYHGYFELVLGSLETNPIVTNLG